jgi:hypothetical protein
MQIQTRDQILTVLAGKIADLKPEDKAEFDELMRRVELIDKL